jgi:DNA (cytosine-5)-methyltransferase 1
LNFDTPAEFIHGDIYKVPDWAFPKELDLLVGGFPCQPFSKLGEQPGFDCHKGRGQLFLEIVRVLNVSRPKSFLLENVPGLLEMKDTFDVIMDALRGAGYIVKAEVCTARGVTATKRNRLFFVGIRNDLVAPKKDRDTSTSTMQVSLNDDGSSFQFPYIPDLKLCSHDILNYESLPRSELDILRLSPETFEQLNNNKRWRPHQLAWPNGHCDPLTSHYGNAVGRGDSQLVPCCSPYPPRRFSVRECARIMGFPNTFQFCPIRAEENQGEMAHRKEGYRMLGNAVCPPLIAALAGSILDAAGVDTSDDWVRKGRRIAAELACAALRHTPVALPAGCIVWT